MWTIEKRTPIPTASSQYQSVVTHIIRLRRLNATEVCRESGCIPGLQEYGTRASEFAHETFARAYARDNATASNTLDHVLAIPSNEVAVVDDVPLAFLQLQQCQPRTMS